MAFSFPDGDAVPLARARPQELYGCCFVISIGNVCCFSHASPFQDWLRGAGFANAMLHTNDVPSVPRAERLRLVLDLLTTSEHQGGANLVPTNPDMIALKATLFTPQNRTFNKVRAFILLGGPDD